MMAPVNITEYWFDDKDFQVIEELTKSLVRPKYMIVLIVTGVVSLIIPMAAATKAAIALF